MIICPGCKGAKITTLFVCGSVSGWRTMPCLTCKGEGQITQEHADRIAKGEAMREDRIKRGLSHREEAKRLGISPQQLSHMEFGRE